MGGLGNQKLPDSVYMLDYFTWIISPRTVYCPRRRYFSVKRLSHASRPGTRGALIRQKAAKIGEAIRAEDGINNALEIINKIIG